VLAHARAPLEPPGERGDREKTGNGASRKMDKMSSLAAISAASLVRAERPKLEFLPKRSSDLRGDAAASAQ
jgi:hypothetical protein